MRLRSSFATLRSAGASPGAHRRRASGFQRGTMQRPGWRRRSRVFSAEWLALREPADTAARSAVLAREVASSFDRHTPVRALDLAAGTGANARYLADHFGSRQDWLLVDHDPQLLAA